MSATPHSLIVHGKGGVRFLLISVRKFPAGHAVSQLNRNLSHWPRSWWDIGKNRSAALRDETRKHWSEGPVTHENRGSVHVLNLVEGQSTVVESPDQSFEPFVVHYSENFVVPAAVEKHSVRPLLTNTVTAMLNPRSNFTRRSSPRREWWRISVRRRRGLACTLFSECRLAKIEAQRLCGLCPP